MRRCRLGKPKPHARLGAQKTFCWTALRWGLDAHVRIYPRIVDLLRAAAAANRSDGSGTGRTVSEGREVR